MEGGSYANLPNLLLVEGGFSSRGGHGEALEKDEILSLFNARVEMNKGHMRLVVDRYTHVAFNKTLHC